MKKTSVTGSETSKDASNTSEKSLKVQDAESKPGPMLYVLVLALAAVYFLVLLNSTVVVTSIPVITTQFNSVQDIGWYGSAYLLANCALQPLSGRLYTFYPLKYCYLSFLAVFELGSLICGVAQSSPMFIVGRAIAGSGASGIMNGCMTIIKASAPSSKIPLFTGIIYAIGAAGQVTGPLIGGLFAQHATWRWSFYINLPLGGLTAVVVVFAKISEQMEKEPATSFRHTLERFDLGGFFLFAGFVVMILLALNYGGVTYPWNSATIIGLFVGAGLTLVAFLLYERWRGKAAMVQLGLLKRRIIVCCYTTAFCLSGMLSAITYYLPLWFQSVKQDSPTMSGVDILPMAGAQVISSFLAGYGVSKIGYYVPFAVGGCMMATIGAGLLSTLTRTSSVGEWLGYELLAGLGRGTSMQQPVSAVQIALSGDEVATGSSMLAFCQYFGGAVFISAANTIFTNDLQKELAAQFPTIDPTLILQGSAVSIASAVPAPDLPGVLAVINSSLTKTFYLSVGLGSLATLTACGMGWYNITKIKASKDKIEPKDPEETVDEKAVVASANVASERA